MYRSGGGGPLRGIIISAAVFIIGAGAFIFGINSVFAKTDEEALRSAGDAIDKAITNCYAVEGRYPDSFTYLSENYGIMIDSDKYTVHFERGGANLRPIFDVLVRGNDDLTYSKLKNAAQDEEENSSNGETGEQWVFPPRFFVEGND